MSAHTPGPWTTGSGDALTIKAGSGARAFKVAEVMPPTQRHRISSDEAFANARLIAAAPDLLKAAEALLEWCNERFDNHGNDWAADAPGGLCDALEAAIEEARGES